MSRDEQRQAEELYSFLKARQTATESTAAELGDDEIKLTDALVDLAKSVQPDPAFASELERRLSQSLAAGRTSSRSSFLHNLISSVTNRRYKMLKRMALALTGAAILALLIFVALPLLSSQPRPAPLSSLPSLPPLSAYAQGGSGTAGGGILNRTEFVLKTTLPSEPDRVPVFRQAELKSFTLDDARRLAARFGLKGQIYLLRVPVFSAGTVPTIYSVFDGSRQLTMSSGSAEFVDSSAASDTSQTPLPFEQAASIAKEFMQAHGLLDFPYRVEPRSGTSWTAVQFVQLADGHPVENAKAEVIVTPAGQVSRVSYTPLTLHLLGDYPIRSAREALDALRSGHPGGEVQISTSRNASLPLRAPAFTWGPDYRPGQRADLYGSPVIYVPAKGNAPLLAEMGGLRLYGDIQALSQQQGTNLHIWGQVREQVPGVLALDIAGWEVTPESALQPFRGVIKREGARVLLQRADGKTFLLPNGPQDVPDGLAVGGQGRETGRTEADYPVLDWTELEAPPSSAMDGSSGGTSTTGVVVEVQTVAPTVLPPPTSPNDSVSSGAVIKLPTPIPPPMNPDGRVEALVGQLSATILQDPNGGNEELDVVLSENPLGNRPGWGARLRGPGLLGIEKYDGLHVRVWGKFVMEDQDPIIYVERYEKAYPEERIQAWLGTREFAKVEGREVVLFKTREGETFVLASFLGASAQTLEWYRQTPMSQVGQVLYEGVVQRETFGGYPIMRELDGRGGDDVNRMTDLKGYQLKARPQVIPLRQTLDFAKAFIEQVELIYYAAPAANLLSAADQHRGLDVQVVQPVWRFAGHTEDGMTFELLVQAVRDEFVK